jgi:4-aminobutyrate aminotransferase
MQHHGVSPDLMTLAKSLAGGTTLSAVCGRAAVMDGPVPGGLGGTYAGHPLAVAAAHAVLDVIDEERLSDRAMRLGDKLVAHLITLRASNAHIGDIRGLGAMVACEFVSPDNGAPDADMARRVQAAALQRGLLLLTCGVNGNVVRYLFPLTIEDPLFDEALAILDAALAEVAA